MHIRPLLVSSLAGWGILGFYRGLSNYDYYTNPYKYYYKDRVIHGIYGTIIYTNPILAILVLNKELYRLEVEIRSLTSERDKSHYYDFF